MSQSYVPLQPILVTDEITDVMNVDKVAIVQSGSQITRKSFTPNTSSSQAISYSCNPPAGNIIVSRNVKLKAGLRLVMNGRAITTDAGFVDPVSLVNANRDGPRKLPLAGCINTVSATINNATVTMQYAEMIRTLSEFYVDDKFKSTELSTTACYSDKSFEYESLIGTNLNPLGVYGNSSEGTVQPRGGFPFTILAGTNTAVVPSTGNGTPCSCTIDLPVTENIMMSPFQFSGVDNNSQGFYNVSSMTFDFNMLTQAGFAAWSHCNLVKTSGAQRITTVIDSISIQYDNYNSTPYSYPEYQRPLLLFEYITPNILTPERLGPNIPITYPFFKADRYPQEIGILAAASGRQTFNSMPVKVTSIPDRIYVYARPSNSVYESRCDIPNCYLGIKAIDVQWANQPSLLTGATPEILYQIYLKNGGNMSWTEWSGYGVNNSAFYPATGNAQFGGIGSILALEMGRDVQLNPGECGGLGGNTWTLQISVTLENMCKSGALDAIPWTLYVVTITSGTFTVTSEGNAQSHTGIITKQDVLNATRIPGLTASALSGGRGGRKRGGDWYHSLADFALKLNDFLRESKLLSKGSKALGLAGVPYASEIGTALDVVGYGNNGGGVIQNNRVGRGSPSGGRAISRNQF